MSTFYFWQIVQIANFPWYSFPCIQKLRWKHSNTFTMYHIVFPSIFLIPLKKKMLKKQRRNTMRTFELKTIIQRGKEEVKDEKSVKMYVVRHCLQNGWKLRAYAVCRILNSYKLQVHIIWLLSSTVNCKQYTIYIYSA